ncbi:MAG: glycosyltransferase family 32 protein [Gemmobacter sp.]
MALMPGARVVVHDRAAAGALVGRLLGKPTLRAFEALAHPAARADLFRLCLIGEEGGVWADADDLPRAPIGDWLGGVDAVVVIEQWWGTLANNFFAARPGFPPILAARDRVARAVRAGPDPYAWWQTGPVPLTRAMAPLLRGGGGDEGARAGAAAVRVLAYADYLARIAPTLTLPHKALGAYWR